MKILYDIYSVDGKCLGKSQEANDLLLKWNIKNGTATKNTFSPYYHKYYIFSTDFDYESFFSEEMPKHYKIKLMERKIKEQEYIIKEGCRWLADYHNKLIKYNKEYHFDKHMPMEKSNRREMEELIRAVVNVIPYGNGANYEINEY